MIHHIVIAGAPDRVVPATDRLVAALEATRIMTGPARVLTDPEGCWALGQISQADPLAAERVATDGRWLAVVNGPALWRDARDGQAADALRRLRAGGIGAVTAQLGGSWNLVTYSPDDGLHALTDFSGICPLYWRQGDGLAIVSTRAGTVAQFARSTEADARALSWLIGHSSLFGERMPARGVRHLAPGRELRTEVRAAEMTVERAPNWIWPDADAAVREDLHADEWDEITDELVGNIRALRDTTQRPTLLLSGGKDSRLCLALAIAAGLGDDELGVTTKGVPEDPDVECAMQVAQAAGFRIQRDGADRAPGVDSRAPAPEPATTWQRLRQSVYRYEGAVCPWDGLIGPLRGTHVRIKGFGGELYRAGHASRFRTNPPQDLDTMCRRFYNYHQRLDPLGVLSEDTRRFQQGWLSQWVREHAEEMRFDLLPDAFYVDYRLGLWNGPLHQGKPGHVEINPLLSTTAARLSLQLDNRARVAELLHYEVMRRTAPELLAVPFVGDSWAPAIRERATRELPQEAYRGGAQVNQLYLKPWQLPFLQSEPRAIAALLRRAVRRTDLGSVCNRRALVRVARRSRDIERNVEAKALLSCIAAAISLLGEVEQVVDDPHPAPV